MRDPEIEIAKPIEGETCGRITGRTDHNGIQSIIYCGRPGVLMFRVIHPPRGRTTLFSVRCVLHVPRTIRVWLTGKKT